MVENNTIVGSKPLFLSPNILIALLFSIFDLSPILYQYPIEGTTHYKTNEQEHGIDNVLDWKMLKVIKHALEHGQNIQVDLQIRNTNRSVGAIISNENSAKNVSKIVDGKFDFILLDVEKKVISKKINQYVNIERAVKETIKKTKIYNYKGNDLTINACETLVNHIYSQDPRGVGGKKILVLGVGNIGFKISLKLLEAGADVYLYRRNKNILSNISKTINFIKPIFC